MKAAKNFERKHYFIDPKLQGRYMLTFLAPMVVMLGLMLFTLIMATRSIVGTASGIIREEIENRVVSVMQDQREPTVLQYQTALEDIGRYMRGFTGEKRYRRALLSVLLWAFGAGVLVVIVQVVLLTVYFSHKVAGPVFRLEKACSAVIDGNYREQVYLRKGDELQNLAGLFNKVVAVTRERLLALRDEGSAEKRGEIGSKLTLDID